MSWLKRLIGEEEPEKPKERTPQTIQVGDGVSYQSEDFIVEQSIEYHGDGGDVWWDFLLVGSNEKYWLGVVEDEGLQLTLYRSIPFHPDMPPSNPITWKNESYRRKEYGFANTIVKKKSKLTTAGRVEYWDYENEDGKQLSIARWGDNEVREDQSEMTGTVECSLGEMIKPYQVKIYPGSQET